jgi:hypothetical protein
MHYQPKHFREARTVSVVRIRALRHGDWIGDQKFETGRLPIRSPAVVDAAAFEAPGWMHGVSFVLAVNLVQDVIMREILPLNRAEPPQTAPGDEDSPRQPLREKWAR